LRQPKIMKSSKGIEVGALFGEVLSGGEAEATADPSTPLRFAQDDTCCGRANDNRVLRFAQDDSCCEGRLISLQGT